ncbi:MAG: histidine--tRNA ligase [Bacteroidota bacterium]
MQAQKPIIVKGTRDFNAKQLAQRNHIFDTIRQVCQRYGFSPLETPTLESLSTLAGQYGQEGEQLIFKVLNSGDFLAEVDRETIDEGHKALAPQITEKGLRYDLTVPLMRYVAMHRQQLIFPFRRYQIQPVWRADRPQKGRYREFYQCDADVVGTPSLICEAEVLAMAYQVLQQLGIRSFTIQLNHRAILKSLAALIGKASQENTFCMVLDKLDKLGQQRVWEELIRKGFCPESLDQLQFIFNLPPTNQAKLEALKSRLSQSEEGLRGLEEIHQILQYITALGAEDIPITIVPTLARGLTYYTGAIFEAKIQSISIGSLGGGGRYDHLTDRFGMPGLTGVGFSWGVDRIYAVMEELGLLPHDNIATTQVMLTNPDKEAEQLALAIATQLRAQGISAEIYPEQGRLKQQLTYANKKDIPFVVIIGSEEKKMSKFVLKEMRTGAQHIYTLDELIAVLR